MLHFTTGLATPSWLVSDGTLRLLALTLLAYIPDLSGIYLIEEPENGIHPRAVETVYQSLSSVYGAQVLLATHSPVILSMAKPKEVLCFARSSDGATNIVSGDEHPALREWQGTLDLGTLFASGILG
jgi:predicted ATPase